MTKAQKIIVTVSILIYSLAALSVATAFGIQYQHHNNTCIQTGLDLNGFPYVRESECTNKPSLVDLFIYESAVAIVTYLITVPVYLVWGKNVKK